MTFQASTLAHIVTTGLGPFYDGFTHLVLSLEDAIPFFALGLLAGMRSSQDAKRALAVLVPAILISALLGGVFGRTSGFPAAAVSFVALGSLIALDYPFSRWCFPPVVILIAAMHGWFSGAAMRLEAGGLPAAIGTTLGAAVLFLLSAGIAMRLRQGWPRICIRVLGSWIAATGFLLLGWWLKSGKNP